MRDRHHIVFTRLITVAAWTSVLAQAPTLKGRDVGSYCEFVRGQRVRVWEWDGDCVRLDAA